MGRKFDLSSLMETVSNLDTTAAAPSVQLIPLEDILRGAAGPLTDCLPHPSSDGGKEYENRGSL